MTSIESSQIRRNHKGLKSLTTFGPGSQDEGVLAQRRGHLHRRAAPESEIVRVLVQTGQRASATVLSASFKGKSRVQQHQLVYQALKGQMGGVLHALALQTGTPEG